MPLRAPVSTDDNVPVVNGHSDPNASILPKCAALAAHVKAFLETEAPSPLLKQVQEQTRIALGVIDEALKKYRFVDLTCCNVWKEEEGRSGRKFLKMQDADIRHYIA
jgi:FAD synthetase